MERCRLLSTIVTVAGWFFFHSLVGILNKSIFKMEGMRFPILLTSSHMLTSFILGHIVLRFLHRKEEPAVNLFAILFHQREFSIRILGLSMVFSLSVVLGNVALQYIGLPFSHIIAALTPVVTFLLDISICKLSSRPKTKYTAMAHYAMLLLTSGAILSTIGEGDFVLFGFLCSLTSTTLRGLKGLIQEQLIKGASVKTTFHIFYLMSLPSFLILLTLGVSLEYHVIYNLGTVFQPKVFSLVVLSSFVAFGYNVFGFLMSLKVSAVAIHILGNVKMVFCIAASLVVFGDNVTLMSWTGVVLTLLGGGLFWYAKEPNLLKKKSD